MDKKALLKAIESALDRRCELFANEQELEGLVISIKLRGGCEIHKVSLFPQWDTHPTRVQPKDYEF